MDPVRNRDRPRPRPCPCPLPTPPPCPLPPPLSPRASHRCLTIIFGMASRRSPRCWLSHLLCQICVKSITKLLLDIVGVAENNGLKLPREFGMLIK